MPMPLCKVYRSCERLPPRPNGRLLANDGKYYVVSDLNNALIRDACFAKLRLVGSRKVWCRTKTRHRRKWPISAAEASSRYLKLWVPAYGHPRGRDVGTLRFRSLQLYHELLQQGVSGSFSWGH